MLGIRQWNLFPYINRNLIAIRAHIFNNSRLLITDFLKAINSSLSDDKNANSTPKAFSARNCAKKKCLLQKYPQYFLQTHLGSIIVTELDYYLFIN